MNENYDNCCCSRDRFIQGIEVSMLVLFTTALTGVFLPIISWFFLQLIYALLLPK